MVQSVNSGGFKPENFKSMAGYLPDHNFSVSNVKVEVEDPLEDEHGSVNKRAKLGSPLKQQQWSMSPSTCEQTSYYNLLNEPSPLGLRLRKSPSLLDLIQMRLSQGDITVGGAESHGKLELAKKDTKCATASVSTADKLKASNFPASILRIGNWECISRYEGDLVAKCYFAKHKLVWEVLDGSLKSKIEIQWSDITALKANYPDNGPGTLDIVLARQPQFYRETNPQPRKHTLWQATSDFTGGQASLHRRHFLQCAQGLLNKHFEKLIQCDPRLNLLSQRSSINLDNPYFDSRGSVFEDPDEPNCHSFEHIGNNYVTPFPGFQDATSLAMTQASSSKSEVQDSVGRASEALETPSPSSVMDSRAIEDNGNSENEEVRDQNQWDLLKVPGLRTSISMKDLAHHIGLCFSEQRESGNPSALDKEVLDDLTQHLFGDSQLSLVSDEKSLMARVNSLCCLLQKDGNPNFQFPQSISEDEFRVDGKVNDESVEGSAITLTLDDKCSLGLLPGEAQNTDISFYKQPATMSRKESVGDLLLHIPRIASHPKMLFGLQEATGGRNK
ncbi:hypothetical protein AMTRI_Chr12g273560 [Amborella trichopoda]|uniref:TRF2/HOY1 PH-like domain-containing protein n=1 Tax=Amborella trichopoda TaxID=13333 RepID=W1PAY2_AMBTC|nr:uncharacterized protein LOC18435287 [Amborella trichopoda]ERN07072.1 hypothetical protein AMTR_s00019p00062450 [Amborella trichopoda]|eukprot:XP_006845397.1 uncharacterized protein LOC18435287 [Amborella trichopoda]